MTALLRWMADRGAARFIATTRPDDAADLAQIADDATCLDGRIQGTLNARAAEWLAIHPVQTLHVYDSDRPTVVVSNGWDQTGVWLGSEQVKALRKHLQPATIGSTTRATLPGRMRAYAIVHSLLIERVAAFVMAFGIVLLLGDSLNSAWEKAAVLLGGMIVTYCVAWLLRRAWTATQSCL